MEYQVRIVRALVADREVDPLAAIGTRGFDVPGDS
jgi:hypothetical protein